MSENLWHFGSVDSWAGTVPQVHQSHLMLTSVMATLVALAAGLTVRRILKRRRDLKEQRRWEEAYWQKEREQCASSNRRDKTFQGFRNDPFAQLNAKSLSSCYRLFNCTSSDSFGRVKEHYRELARTYHPDASQDRSPETLMQLERKMNMINQAYQTILHARRESLMEENHHFQNTYDRSEGR